MSSDLIADMLTRVRNAQRAGHRSVKVRASSVVENILNVLRAEGMIESFEKRASEEIPVASEYNVVLKYFETGDPLIKRAERVSASGCRVYAGSDKLPRVNSGLGMSIISTSQGIMSDREARKKKIGGEIIALIG